MRVEKGVRVAFRSLSVRCICVFVTEVYPDTYSPSSVERLTVEVDVSISDWLLFLTSKGRRE